MTSDKQLTRVLDGVTTGSGVTVGLMYEAHLLDGLVYVVFVAVLAVGVSRMWYRSTRQVVLMSDE